MRNGRRLRVLNLVAQVYIATARPVASAQVADRLAVSSATIRNDFAALEEEGLLLREHASSGRIPSPAGLGVYARSFMPPAGLTKRQQLFIRSRLDDAHGADLLQAAARVAAELSGYAVAVRLLPDDSLRALSVHLSVLPGNRLLAVAILENGLVREHTLSFRSALRQHVLAEAEALLRQLALPVSQLAPALTELAANRDGDLRLLLLGLAAAAPSLSPGLAFSYGLENLLKEPEAQDPAFLEDALRELEAGWPTRAASASLDFTLDGHTARVRTVLPLNRLRAELSLVGPARMRYPEAFRIAGGLADTLAAGRTRAAS